MARSDSANKTRKEPEMLKASLGTTYNRVLVWCIEYAKNQTLQYPPPHNGTTSLFRHTSQRAARHKARGRTPRCTFPRRYFTVHKHVEVSRVEITPM